MLNVVILECKAFLETVMFKVTKVVYLRTQKEYLSKSNLTELINELFNDNENIDIMSVYKLK